MKSILVFGVLLLMSVSYGQSENGIKLRSNIPFGFLNFYESAEYDITREDSSTTHMKSSGRINSEFLFGAEWQLGYRFNDHWSTGIHAGVSFSVEESIEFFDLFDFPTFHLYPSAGVYGQYHFENELSIVGMINVNKYPRYTPSISFGAGPQLFFGQNQIWGLRLFLEYGVGGDRNAFTSGYDDHGYYEITNAQRSNSAFMIEIGIIKKWFNT